MDGTTIIRIVAGMLFLAIFVGYFVMYIFYILTLSRALTKCSIASRTLQPGSVWLLLVPFVNLVWQFIVVIGVADSLGNEFRVRNTPNIGQEPGKSIGLAMCICAVCTIIPILGLLAFLAHLVLWIIYWSKIAEFSRILDQVPAINGATPYVPQYPSPGMPYMAPVTNQYPPSPSPVVVRRSTPAFVWVLVGLAGFIPVLLILALIAIPTIGSLKKKANETSAINSMQTISKAELQYVSTYPSNGYACSLSALGGDPSTGSPSATGAQILQGDLTGGFKSGYIFTINSCNKVTVNGNDRFTGYQITAVPQTVGKTGNRGFCTDESGQIKFDSTGGTNCTETLGQ